MLQSAFLYLRFVFENRVLTRILGCKRDEVTGVWIKLHNVLHAVYSTPNIVVNKSSLMRWMGNTRRAGGWEMETNFGRETWM